MYKIINYMNDNNIVVASINENYDSVINDMETLNRQDCYQFFYKLF